MKCFYHSADLDGHCSGAIVKYKYPECELIGINYGDPFPWHTLKDEFGSIFLVDFSLQPFEKMVKLQRLVGHRLIWIDHHISAMKDHRMWIDDHQAFLFIDGMRSVGQAGCELTWEYMFPYEPVPPLVELLGRYDVWDHSDPRTLPLQYGLRIYETRPEDSMDSWSEWFKAFPFHILKEGETILRYIQQDNKKYCSACSFDIDFDGLRCIAVNRALTNSQVFDSVWDSEKYDAMLTFAWLKRSWRVSLYSDREDIDVSQIAKAHGGGGHKGAAGFQCNVLPFVVLPEETRK